MEIKELGDVLELQRGYDLPHSEMNEGVVPVAGSNGIIGYHDVAKLQPPCITIGRSGSVGKLHRYDVPVWPHNTSLFISDFKGNDDKYLFYLLKTIDFNKVCDSSVIPSLNRNFVYPIKIYFETDVKKQKKIASVLSALDDKIALNKKMNQKLEAMAKRLYDYWFVQYDFPNKNGHPYKTTGGPMTYNPTLKREIPVGWDVKTLADFAEYVKTTTKFDKAFNYVSTDNMMPQKQGLSGEILKPASGNVLCYEKDDILISNIRPYFKKIWYADQSGTCSTDVLCIRSLNSDNSYFVYKTLWQDDFFDYVMQGAKGSKMPRGDKDQIMDFKVSTSLNEAEIGDFIANIGQAIDNLTAINRNLPDRSAA